MAVQPTTDPIPIAAMSAMIPIHLNSTNFLAWKHQALPIIEAFELLEFIDGSSVAPSPTITTTDGSVSPNPTYLAWRKNDQKLLSVIIFTQTEEAIGEVVHVNPSIEL